MTTNSNSKHSADDVRACAKRMKFYDHQIAASILNEYADLLSQSPRIEDRAAGDVERNTEVDSLITQWMNVPYGGDKITKLEAGSRFAQARANDIKAALASATPSAAGDVDVKEVYENINGRRAKVQYRYGTRIDLVFDNSHFWSKAKDDAGYDAQLQTVGVKMSRLPLRNMEATYVTFSEDREQAAMLNATQGGKGEGE